MNQLTVLFSMILFSGYLSAQTPTAERIHPNPLDFPEPNPHAIDIYILGEGYDQPAINANLFNAEADQFLDELINTAPFEQYRNYFNVYRLDGLSADPGLDIPENACSAIDVQTWELPTCIDDVTVNTRYNCRLLGHTPCTTGNTNLYRLIDWDEVALMNDLLPVGYDAQSDPIMLLVNTDIYSGHGNSEDPNTMIAAACSPPGNSVADMNNDKAMHEFGHAFGNLTDEYYCAETVEILFMAGVFTEK